MVAVASPPFGGVMMERPRPGQAPGAQQLRIPTPQDLERMRKQRAQLQQQRQQRHAAPLQRLAPHKRPQQQRPPALPVQTDLQQVLADKEDGDDDEEEEQRQAPPPAQWQLGQQQQRQQQQTAAAGPGGFARRPSQQQPLAGPQRTGVPPPPRSGLPPRGTRPPARAPKDDVFTALAEECDLEEAWRPQVLLLHELGLRAADLQRLSESRPEIFQMGVVTMRRKLKFFQDTIGLSNVELTKVIVKFPRILEYRSERTIRPRLEFLKRCGVTQEELAKVFVRAPMALELRVKDTLEPRAAFLRDVLALSSGALGKLIVRHPQVLTCTQEMMQQRVEWLQQQGLEQAELARAVLAHPQVLHYKIDSMEERLGYLRSIGLDQTQVAACVSRFPQLLSLNIEANMAPKWRYLVDFMRTPADPVTTLCSYPAFFSLSLTNRVMPRHRYFLATHARRGATAAAPLPAAAGAAVKAAGGKAVGGKAAEDEAAGGKAAGGRKAKGRGPAVLPGEGVQVPAFPMSHLKCTDAQFAKICGTSLDEYTAFRAELFGGMPLPPSGSPSDSSDEDI